MNLEGYAAWLGMPVGASRAVWSSTASAQDNNAPGMLVSRGQAFSSVSRNIDCWNNLLGKHRGLWFCLNQVFPPFCPQESKTRPMQINIAWMWYTGFLNPHALDTGFKPQGKYVIMWLRIMSVIVSRGPWRSVDLQRQYSLCQCAQSKNYL